MVSSATSEIACLNLIQFVSMSCEWRDELKNCSWKLSMIVLSLFMPALWYKGIQWSYAFKGMTFKIKKIIASWSGTTCTL